MELGDFQELEDENEEVAHWDKAVRRTLRELLIVQRFLHGHSQICESTAKNGAKQFQI